MNMTASEIKTKHLAKMKRIGKVRSGNFWIDEEELNSIKQYAISKDIFLGDVLKTCISIGFEQLKRGDADEK